MTFPRRRVRWFHHTCQEASSTSPYLQVFAVGFLQWQYPESRVFYKINNAVSSPRFFQPSKISRQWSPANQKIVQNQPWMIRPSMWNNSYTVNWTSTSIRADNGRILRLLHLTYNGLSTEEWWILKAPRATSCRRSPYPVPMCKQDLHSTLLSTLSTKQLRS